MKFTVIMESALTPATNEDGMLEMGESTAVEYSEEWNGDVAGYLESCASDWMLKGEVTWSDDPDALAKVYQQFEEPDGARVRNIFVVYDDGTPFEVCYALEIEADSFADVENHASCKDAARSILEDASEGDLRELAHYSTTNELLNTMRGSWLWSDVSVEHVARELCRRLDVDFDAYDSYDNLEVALDIAYAKTIG